MFHKRFVPEARSVTSSTSAQTNEISDGITGDEAMSFYLDLLSSTDHRDVKSNKPSRTNGSSRKKKKCCTLIGDNKSEKLSARLLSAAQHNDVIEMRRILSTYPSIVNSRDSFGWTPLMCAVQSNATSAIKLLLKYGADVNISDTRGRSATSLAQSINVRELLSDEKTLSANLTKSPEQETFCESCKQCVSNGREAHDSSILHILNAYKNSETRTHYGIPENNKGFQILVKNGWNRGKGLGPDGTGKKFPVKTSLKKDRYGIGAVKPTAKITHTFNDIEQESQNHRRKYAPLKCIMSKEQREKQFERNFRMEFA